MLFILLSIVSFVLRTLPRFEIVDYDLISVYIGNNSTGQTPVHNRQRREISSSFDMIEWICMKKKFNENI